MTGRTADAAMQVRQLFDAKAAAWPKAATAQSVEEIFGAASDAR
jgi:hypothetical protein